MASHLELSPPTIKSYLRRLEDFYLVFKVHPYSKNIKRALLKVPKCYLYDWTRLKEDTDFLVLKNGQPWLLVETKISDGPIAAHHHRMQAALGGVPFVQLCRQDGICVKEEGNRFRISASRLLA